MVVAWKARARVLMTLVALAALGALALASSADAAAKPRCTIKGTAGNDVLRGTPGRDVICGYGGNDVIYGRGGDDLIFAGAGNDRVYGGAGDDTILGGPGNDRLYGGAGQDRIDGGSGHDTVAGGAGDDQTGPLKENPPWQVNITPSYDLPIGTKVHFQYDPPSGNCIKDYSSWTETVGNAGSATSSILFHVVVGNPWESCAWERSYGSWNVTVTLPTGESKTINFRVETGLPNIYEHRATLDCHPVAGLPCTGGSDAVLAKVGNVPSPSLHIGPFNAEPPPSPPQLICTGTLHLKVGQVLNGGEAGHFCTIQGYPRPTVTFDGLPDGLTAARWPTATDTWIALSGRVTTRFLKQVIVDARLPSGWHDTALVTMESSP